MADVALTSKAARWANGQALLGVFAAAALVWTLVGAGAQGLAFYWIMGMAFGFVFQRSRLCFTAAFRDLFLMQDGRLMRAVLAGLAIATVGFTVVMMDLLPRTGFGSVPSGAHVSPVGIHLIAGGLLFGFGMVVAGGCVSGSLYRVGEGYVASWAAVAGMLLGLELGSHTWNWWWSFSMGGGPVLWLPNYLGYGGSVTLVLAALAALYLTVLWWESRRPPLLAWSPPREPASAGVGAHLRSEARKVFVHGWPALAGGVALAGLNILLFVDDHPLGVTGELAVWADRAAGLVQLSAPPFIGEVLAGCNLVLMQGASWLTDTFFLDTGLVFGSFVAALGAREFKLRFPREKRRYLQSVGGGVFMGYGATIAIGCTIGAFFSAIPSLSVSGWIFAAALLGGSYLGVKALRFLP